MQQQIKMLCQILSDIDNNPAHSMKYYTGSGIPNRTLQDTPADDIRWELVKNILHHVEHSLNPRHECTEIDGNIPKMLDRVNTFYHTKQHLCWPSHRHHFHTCFKDYVNCPITCLSEITEFLEKVMKEAYAG